MGNKPYWLLTLALLLGCSEPRPAPPAAPDAQPAEEKAAQPAVKEEPMMPKRIEGAFPAQVAGMFYTGAPADLEAEVRGYLGDAGAPSVAKERDLVAILSPHAGYRYSGPVAGEAYQAAVGRGHTTVVVLALSHKRAARKVSVLDRPAYDTPLGSVPVDRELARRLIAEHGELFEANEEVFRGEHSLEVQLPFVQIALPGTKVVPIIVAVRDEDVAERAGRALHAMLGKRKDVLFVVSSDLSHHHPYDIARGFDEENLSLLEQWDIGKWRAAASRMAEGMCGYRPLLALVGMLEGWPAKARLVERIDYRNSGDTAGDKSSVVGYGALAFSLEPGVRTEVAAAPDFGPYGEEARRELMALAKKAVSAAARGESFEPPPPTAAILAEPGAAFVTLKKRGDLRGCIGHVIARVPLYRCVADVARSAAIHDTRFSKVTPDELPELTFEISVLTAPAPTTPDEVVVGRDGLIMSRGGRSGLLLPQVPIEWGWEREEFLEHTCRKAGLPVGCWRDPETVIQSFRAIVWGEDE
ncbi:MAG TPA: AmmeMemoRadiSam system protein B [Polyangia bacterium]|nr:AmmeMemoRadiSam system protein B [Polyangia bacterium]